MIEPAELVEISPTPYGYAVFMRAKNKVFMFYVDFERGRAMQCALDGLKDTRPLTHEFIVEILDGLDCKVRGVVFYHEDKGAFFTRITLDMKNELGCKVVEIDARPSDTIAVALRVGAPILIESELLERLADVSDVLNKLRGV